MKVFLIRDDSYIDGVYGKLWIDEKYFCETLSPDKDDKERFFIPPGEYVCKRFHGEHWKNTFEIIVPGHTALLFHILNWEDQSKGCIGLGCKRVIMKDKRALTGSKLAFDKFIELTKGVNTFDLTIKDIY